MTRQTVPADFSGEDAIQLRRKRALYRAAHRGTKEMDLMLGRYGEAKLGGMTEAELTVFEALLEEQDPEINQWLFSPETCDQGRYQELISALRSFNSIG